MPVGNKLNYNSLLSKFARKLIIFLLQWPRLWKWTVFKKWLNSHDVSGSINFTIDLWGTWNDAKFTSKLRPHRWQYFLLCSSVQLNYLIPMGCAACLVYLCAIKFHEMRTAKSKSESDFYTKNDSKFWLLLCHLFEWLKSLLTKIINGILLQTDFNLLFLTCTES